MGSRIMKADPLKSVSFSSITDSYSNIGSALANVWQQIVIKNNTNATVFVSENGTDDHYELPPNTIEYYDFQTNASIESISGKAVGTQFTVKANTGFLPTKGSVILQGQYQ